MEKIAAASGTEGALVDKLNTYVNNTSGLNGWALTANGYPEFQSLNDVKAAGVTVTYDGSPHSIELNGVPKGAIVTYSTDGKSYGSNKPSVTDVTTGTTIYYRVQLDTKEKTGSAKVIIKPAEIDITWGTTTFDYDGNVHIPTAKATGMVKGDTLELTVATDSGNAIDAGTHRAKVTGITGTKAGNYTLPSNVTKSYTINQVSLSKAGITITGADTLTYTGKEQKPGITVTLGDKTLTANTDYTVSYGNNINATTDTSRATVTITGTGNYKETAGAKFDIKKAALTVTADNKTIKYGENKPNYTVSYDGFVNGETKDTAGVFGGKLTFACDYVKAGSTGSTDNSKAGTYTITPSGLTSANYDISFVNGTLTVERAAGQVSIASVVNKIYGDADFALSVDKHGSDGALTYTSDKPEVLTVDSTGNVNLLKAGTAKITVSMAADTNHTAATNSIDITVAKKAATLQVTKVSYTATYGDDDIDLGLKTEGESAVTYDSTDDTVATAVDGKLHIVGAGTAIITLSMAESTNYLAKKATISVTVNKAKLTITAHDKSTDYGTAAPAFTVKYDGFKNGDKADKEGVFSGKLGFDCRYKKGDATNGNTGTYDIIPKGLEADNYTIGYVKGTLTVRTVESSVSIKKVAAKTYGDAAFDLTVTKSGSTVAPEYESSNTSVLTVNADGKVTIKGAGTAMVTVNLPGDHNHNPATDSVSITVNKKALTVTADNSSITYGDAAPAYTATYDGLVNGETNDTAGVFGGTLTFACDYVKAGSTDGSGAGSTGAGNTDNSKAGTYTITPSGLTSANYDISFVNGTLTVERAAGQVSIDAIGEKTYGDADFALSVDKHGSDGALTYTSDKPEVLTVDSTGNVKLLKAGTATITVQMAEGTNHTAATNSIDITVAKKAATLQVTKVSYTATYGDDDIDLGLQKEGESDVSYTSTDDAVATAADGKLHIVGAGTATITLSMAESTNYLAKDVKITVKVNPAVLTITAENETIDYGTAAPAFTVKYDGFKNADTADKEGVFSGKLGFDCSYKKGDATNGNTGTYDIIPKGLEADNYTIGYVKGTLTVRTVESSVSIKKVAAKTYGDAAFALTVAKSGSTAAPEYASSNTSVLTVDTNGKVTIKGAGTATVTVTLPADNNHNPATDSVSITVKKKALTVTADNKSITYGDAAPAYTATYAGFVNGETKDTVGVFDGKLTFACDYVKVGSGADGSVAGSTGAGSTDNSNAGTYTITPSGLTSANYEISFVNGTLTVEQATGQVSIDAIGEKTYGDADFALSVDKHGSDGALTYTSDKPEVLTVDSTGNVKLLKAGTAKITVSMAADTNHTAATNSIDITVAKKEATLQVTKVSYTATYGDDDIDLGLTTEGEIAVAYTSTDDAVATAADGKLHIVGAGTATITLSMAESTNYLAKDVKITVKVNPAVLTVTAENKTIDYGTAAPAFTVKYDGFKNADTADKEGVLSGKLGFDCSYKKGDAANGKAGNYDITPKGLTAQNYVITFAKGILTVKEKAPEPSKDFGDSNNTSTNGENTVHTHTYTAAMTKAPTTTEEGIITYTCTICGNVFTQPIAKIVSDAGSNKNNSSKNTESRNNSDTEIKPYIKDDSGKEGWDVISSRLDEAKSGETVTVAMNGTTVVPKDIFDSIKGEDVTLVLDMGNGLSWKINGKDITDAAGDIDFGVTVGADAGKSIPVDVINNVTGERYSMNLSLAYDGEFGFTARLTINMESKNTGLYANLFYYNEQTGKLEFVSAGLIDADGNVELEFTHASDYTIVIDASVMDGGNKDSINTTKDNENAEDNTTIPASNADNAKSDAWNPAIIIIIGICILLIVFGAVIFVRKKSSSEEE